MGGLPVHLEVQDLTKSFGDHTVLRQIGLQVRQGEFCILLGPSGCGKTTLLRIIAGLEELQHGTIRIGGRDVTHLSPRERDVAMVFQSYALYPHLTVRQNLAFPLKARKLPRDLQEEKILMAARLLGIEPLLDRKPRHLSGGQRQRVAIGRALVRDPSLFLFDEPLSNLDAKLRASMRVELARLHRELEATTVYVTHDQVEAMTLGERIVLLHEGVIQQAGSPRELYERPANLFVAGFIGSPSINLIEGKLARDGDELYLQSRGLRVPLGPRSILETHVGQPVTAGIRPESLTPGDGNLSGRLERVEHLGPETLLYVETDGGQLVAKGPSDWTGQEGDPIHLGLHGQVHLFRDGVRLS